MATIAEPLAAQDPVDSPPRSPHAGSLSLDNVADAPREQRVSFYVQAADDMLDAVFKHEAFLFSDKEQHALRRFRLLEYQSRYLFMRLFLRKHGWIRLDGIGYENDITDLDQACEALWRVIEFTPSPAPLPLASDERKRELNDARVPTTTGNRDQGRNPTDSRPNPSTTTTLAKLEPRLDDSYFLDLTMSDDDDDLKPSPPHPPRNAAVAADGLNAKDKDQKRKKLGDCADEDEEMDLSRLAQDKETLANEDPQVALGLLSLDELVALGKRMKVSLSGKPNRGEWTKALLRTSNQSTLSFFTVSKRSTKSGGDKCPTGNLGVGYDHKGNKLKQSTVVARQALQSIGPVIRLHPAYLTLFNRLSLVYHRTSYTATSSQPNNTTSLTASLLARFGKRRYPSYVVQRSFSIFPSRKSLKQFEAAMDVERRVEEALEGVWGPGVPKRGERETVQDKRLRYKVGTEVWQAVEDEWIELCTEAECEMKGQEDDDEKRRLYYRRRFHPGWPLSRAAYKAAACYAKLGDHDREVSILRFLLAQTSFRRGKRGDWYDRLALVLMKYPLGEELSLGEDAKASKKDKFLKQRRDEALKICQDGLNDPFTHLIYKSSLQRRIARIESALDVPKDDRRTFQILLRKAEQRVMEGERLDDPTIGKKSVWRASDGDEVSVEELALEHFHSENGVLTSIFALVFWDIIFAPVDGVFETEFQSAPLDLATDAFAIVRRPAIQARLEAVARGEASRFLRETDDRERPLGTWAVGIRWDRFPQEDLVEIVDCIGGPSLAAILTVFVEEYGHRTGGIPDLCLWNPTEHRVRFSEVKGPGDNLSETQKVWIDVLLSVGVEVELCRVVESRTRDLGRDDGDEDNEEEEEGEDDGENVGDGEEGKRKRPGKGNKRKRARSKSAATPTPARSRSRSTSTVSKRAAKRARTEEIDLVDDDD
ncbi:hypothetical protein JCM10212_001111 [Sporobolomyces blumeae]